MRVRYNASIGPRGPSHHSRRLNVTCLTPNLFTDADLAPFARPFDSKPVSRRGRSRVDASATDSIATRKVQYGMLQEVSPCGRYVTRTYRGVMPRLSGHITVGVQANSFDRLGYGFASVLLFNKDGKAIDCWMMNETTLRSQAAAMLAAANSIRATWRK